MIRTSSTGSSSLSGAALSKTARQPTCFSSPDRGIAHYPRLKTQREKGSGKVTSGVGSGLQAEHFRKRAKRISRDTRFGKPVLVGLYVERRFRRACPQGWPARSV